MSSTTPVLVELKPTGAHYMEDLHASGELPAVLHELRDLLDLSALTVTGETLGERLGSGPVWVDREVVRPLDSPSRPEGGLVWLQGSLAPAGALIKRSAADPALFETTGRAVVFSSLADLAERIDDPELDVTASDVLVLQNAGPIGAGMPEAGYLPIPGKLAKAGVPPPPPAPATGYRRLFHEHVLGADEGCDFDFCRL
ncbi:dihydroxy-acid dehydratase domain-containing protein [Kribbella sp. ALI-6-A]|uniref:dihydroxy-acid dehydratase domain-containing protein n=1 Tax=Kribbella sp. ALI-6-A TaxID=1933817 RepID=UPI000A0267FB|nr:dihydroxy-acid dehydratase [Kribbella sp. ALI-6-A]